MTVSNIEVTVNTCTCTDVFTIITTKDQSGGILASFPGGRRKSAWYILFAHACNYSKGHVVELGACTNMTINGSRE